MSDLVLFWHRRDLRLGDNLGLNQALALGQRLVGVFCFDPGILNRPDTAARRVLYLLGCLEKLQSAYARLGSHLLILRGEPAKLISELAELLQVKAVVWNLDVEPYAQDRDRSVNQALKSKGIPSHNYWDQLLHSPDQVYSGAKQPYTVFTPFWKNWLRLPKLQPLPTPNQLCGLTEAELQVAQQAGASLGLPTAQDLAVVGTLEQATGEAAALDQLHNFLRGAIDQYQEQRNFPAIAGTSQLSAALKFGTIGIRTLWQASQDLPPSTETAKASRQTWHQELAWREFYQHALYHFPRLIEAPYRHVFQEFPWSDRQDHFQAWCAGQTGYPIVDAAMRQLNQTGWMHNRCRMIVASFLSKDLMLNWRWGEKYFMQQLVDGDLAANNGGWQWSASCGMDRKPLRIFNPYTQAEKFDPTAQYIRHWLPELRSLPTKTLLSGKITPLEHQATGYPPPIVDHQQQQAKFKAIYAKLKQVTPE